MIGLINAVEKNGKVIIEITPEKGGKVSTTGKSKIYASTGGFTVVAGVTGYALNLNMVKKV